MNTVVLVVSSNSTYLNKVGTHGLATQCGVQGGVAAREHLAEWVVCGGVSLYFSVND